MWKIFHSVENRLVELMPIMFNFPTHRARAAHGGACVEIDFWPVSLWVFWPLSAAAGVCFSFQLPPGRGPLLGGITGRRPRSGRLGQN